MSFWLLLIPFLILIIGYIAFPSFIAYANKIDYLDKGQGRKRHKDSIPPVGGWLIYIAFIISYLLCFVIPSPSLASAGVLFGVSGIFILGLVDDKHPMNALQKFAGQFFISAILVFIGEVHFAEYMSLYGIPYALGQFLCMVIIVFMVNAFNLVDGINGLAALLGFVAIGFLAMWLFSAGLLNYCILALSILAALLVFLRFNLFKPRVFLGDNGSMIIGLLAVLFAFKFIKTYTGASSLLLTKCSAEVGVALTALAIPIADTLRLFFLRPYYLAKSPFKADRNHVHHLLLRIGFNHAEASLLLFGLAILLILAALAAQDLGSIAVVLINSSICVAFLMALDFLVFSKYRRRVNKKTLFNSLQNISQDLNYPIFLEYIFAISIFLLAISIPFHRVSASIPTLILVFSFIALVLRNLIVFRNSLKEVFIGKLQQFLKHPYSILIILLLILSVLHIFFGDSAGVWSKLSIYILLFIYWVSMFQFEKIIQIKPRVLLTAFIAGCFGFGVYILMQSFVEFPTAGWQGFTYKGLLSNVKANPVTHSLYYNLAILFLGNNYKYLKREEWRIFYWIMLIFFIFMVMLCSSKVGYFVLFFTLITAIYNFIKNKRIAITGIFIFTLLLALVSLSFGVFSRSFILSALDSRIIVWQESIKLIEQNPFLGNGIGNSTEALSEAFKQINYERGIAKGYNAQNQFLESFLEMGVIGFLLLLAFMGYSYWMAWMQRNKLYFAYLSVIMIYMVTESLWQTQMGMVSFAFFNALFLASFYAKKSQV